MDAQLRCNNIRSCRTALTEQAVVTTCSHVFCLTCAHKSGLSRSREAERKCPACGTQLSNPDDAVTAVLQPTEDYKTSVLSGLDPTTIMECAGRGLAFWAYQTTQEILYNEAMGKNLADKYSHLSSQLDKIISDANSEIQSLQNKVKGCQADQKALQQKNVELIEMYREKSKKQAQTRHLYDTLKKRVMTSQVQTAASDSVDQAIQSISGIPRPETFENATFVPPETTNSHPPVDSGNGRFSSAHYSRSPSQSSRNNVGEGRTRTDMPPPPGPMSDHRSHGASLSTPQHRRHLPDPGRNSAPSAAARSQIPLSINQTPGTARRQPLANMTNARNAQSGSGGYGITAGMKVGRLPRSNFHGAEKASDSYNARLGDHGGHVDAFGNERSFSHGDYR